jgi:hypothetical protein
VKFDEPSIEEEQTSHHDKVRRRLRFPIAIEAGVDEVVRVGLVVKNGIFSSWKKSNRHFKQGLRTARRVKPTPLLEEKALEKQGVLEAAKMMLVSARTAPKTGGVDDILLGLADGYELESLATF